MTAYQNNYAQVCAALLVAVCDALRIAPCKDKFSCLKKRYRRGSLRGFIRQCWKYVPAEAQAKAFGRLQLYSFAHKKGYFPCTTWEAFLMELRDGAPLGQALQDEFGQWQATHKRQRPEKLILRMIAGQPSPSLAAAAYILEPIGQEAKFRIGQYLLPELERVCHHIVFVASGQTQQLEIQFVHGGPVEQRPLDPGFAL
jgi:hypothetical protein